MQARSILDYLSSDDHSETQNEAVRQTVVGPNLVERLNELERKLGAALEQVTPDAHADLVGEIQAILRGKGIVPRSTAHDRTHEQRDPSMRVRIDAPGLVPDEGAIAFIDRADVAKFAQAVQLLGIAAERFLPPQAHPAPSRSDRRLDEIEAKLAGLQEDFRALLQHLGGSKAPRR